jgi:hypothetical protein
MLWDVCHRQCGVGGGCWVLGAACWLVLFCSKICVYAGAVCSMIGVGETGPGRLVL